MTTINFCGNCGTRHEDDKFCRGCGVRLVPTASEPSAEQLAKMRSAPLRVGADERARAQAPNTTGRSRNGGNVAWGVFWGFVWIPSIAVMMLAMRPGAKREDRVFGYWLGTAAGIALAVVIVVLAAGVSSGTQAGAQGDRVVGVIHRCGLVGRELSGDNCTSQFANDRLEVTVRTAAATTYTVDIPPGTRVAVGDTWPPTR